MKHTLILACTGLLMGLLTSLVGLPIVAEVALWIILYLLWVVYAVRIEFSQPVRRLAFASTLAGLITGSIQVILMEQYQVHNPWYSASFETSVATDLSTQFLGRGIAVGVVCGLVVGLVVRWRQSRKA